MPVKGPYSDLLQEYLQFTSPAQSRLDLWFPEEQRKKIEPKHVEDLDFFIPEEKLLEYFRKRLQWILIGLRREDLDLEEETIQNGYLKVFAILLRIDEPRAIAQFLPHESLNDTHLPFETRPKLFPELPGHSDRLWVAFNESQWIFCAPKITYNERRVWHERQPLPVISKEQLSSGNSAKTFKIRIHPYHNGLGFKNFQCRDTDQDVFVLKIHSNRPSAHQQGIRESEAFAQLKKSISWEEHAIVRFLGSFEKGQLHHTILEYANKGTLENYWQKQRPPKQKFDRQDEVASRTIASWDNALQLLRALDGIHNVEYRPGAYRTKGKGWHQDIKPFNILCHLADGHCPFACVYKLADFGLTSVLVGASSNDNITDRKGTRAYGAPETYRSDDVTEIRQRKLCQKSDVWSLGCVLAEHAVWIHDGAYGLGEFRERRNEALQKLGIRNTGCFHNGKKALDVVDQELRRIMEKTDPKTDPITEEIVEQIILQTLQPISDRPSARDLDTQARMIIERAKRDLKHSKDSIKQERTKNAAESPYVLNQGAADAVTNADPAQLSKELPHQLQITGSPQTPLDSDLSPRSHSRQSITTGLSRGVSLFDILSRNTFDVITMKQAIDRGADANKRQENGRTPIMVAAIEGKFDAVRFLLQRDDVDLNLKDKRKWTLLHHLVQVKGETPMLGEVLKYAQENAKRLNVSAADSGGWTPLHEAARAGKCGLIRILLEYGAEIDNEGWQGRSPCYEAFKYNKVDALTLLLKKGSRLILQVKDLEGRSPSMLKRIEKYGKPPKESRCCIM
ncbi:MAG: hypothetical protein M1820_001225 [Bogoriella megaspora]|nr:MAG: hypothetical protein M1820_001225 [Bogoriella megaspora]